MLLLLRLEPKQKDSSNPFRIRIFFFLSFSFGIETIETFIQSRSFLKNHTRFQTRMGKAYTRFQTKTAQKPDPMGGGTHLCSIYKGVPPRAFTRHFDGDNFVKWQVISSSYRTINCVLELINYWGTKSASMKRSELHCSIQSPFPLSLFYFRFSISLSSCWCYFRSSKFLKSFLFYAKLERIKIHTVLETKLVCLYSLNRLIEREKTFQIN